MAKNIRQTMIVEIDTNQIQQQQQQLPNISRIRGVWGDPDVHDLTPTRTSHVKRSFPTDPPKIFLKKILKTTFCKRLQAMKTRK